MTVAAFSHRLLNAAERPIGAWYDRAGSGLAIPILLALFVVAWTLFHTVSQASIGLHFDVTELFSWSRHLSAGYYKHPPLGALMMRVWLNVFPAADWSVYLLAMTNSAAALFVVDRIAARYLDGDKRLLVILLLLLTPFYQFHSHKFNANQILLSIWPIATYCFLRAFETRGVLWSTAAGVAAALAMLGKYYSIYLIGSFVVAALVHPARWTYLKSASPWISGTVGLALLAPHLHWLTNTGFEALAYAVETHASGSLLVIFGKIGTYLLGALAYVAVPIAVWWLAVRPDRQALADLIWPSNPDRRMLVVLLAGQLLLPPLSSPFLGVTVTSLWTMSAWFLLPIVLLSSPRIHMQRQAAIRVALLVGAVTLGTLVAAPAIAWTYHLNGVRQYRAYFAPLSEELTRQWRELTGRPLTIVLGHPDLAAGAGFYSPDRPDAMPDFKPSSAPWITPERLRREGWVAVCPSEDQRCLRHAELRTREPDVQPRTIETTPTFLGRAGKPHQFSVWMIPPK